MKSFTSLAVVAASISMASATGVTFNQTTGEYECAVPNGVYCAGEGTNIIIRCTNGVGQPGNCNDNLAGQPPQGVNYAQCYPDPSRDGFAACSKNCIVYGGSGNLDGTFPVPYCTPSTTITTGAPTTTLSPPETTIYTTEAPPTTTLSPPESTIYTTVYTTDYTTYCPSPTTFTYGTQTITVTEPTYVTIPCPHCTETATYVVPTITSTSTYCPPNVTSTYVPPPPTTDIPPPVTTTVTPYPTFTLVPTGTGGPYPPPTNGTMTTFTTGGSATATPTGPSATTSIIPGAGVVNAPGAGMAVAALGVIAAYLL